MMTTYSAEGSTKLQHGLIETDVFEYFNPNQKDTNAHHVNIE